MNDTPFIVSVPLSSRLPGSEAEGMVCEGAHGEYALYREKGLQLFYRPAAIPPLQHDIDRRALLEKVASAFTHQGPFCITGFDEPAYLIAWEPESGRLTLTRDLCGCTTLFYTIMNGYVLVSNTLHHLVAKTGKGQVLSRYGVELYLALGFVPAPMCICEGCHKLSPGSALILDRNGNTSTVSLLPVPELAEYGALESRDLTIVLEEKLLSSLVPLTERFSQVTLLLSGGIDSSLLACLLSRQGSGSCNTVAIEAGQNDSLQRAQKVAEILHLQHTSLRLPPFTFEMYGKMVASLDEPLADSMVYPLQSLFEHCATDGGLFISGVGADSLFCGLSTHMALSLLRQGSTLSENAHRHLGARLAATVGRELSLMKSAPDFVTGWSEVFTVLPSDIRTRLWQRQENSANHPSFVQSFFRTWFQDSTAEIMRAFRFDAEVPMADSTLQILRQTVRHCSCFQSTPFLSNQILNFSRKLPLSMLIQDGVGKQPLRSLIQSHLPSDLWMLPKIGFSLQVDKLLKTNRSYIEDLFRSDEVLSLKKDGLSAWLGWYFDGPGQSDYRAAKQIWSVAALLLWIRTLQERGQAVTLSES